jgi:hypothetical protein
MLAKGAEALAGRAQPDPFWSHFFSSWVADQNATFRLDGKQEIAPQRVPSPAVEQYLAAIASA